MATVTNAGTQSDLAVPSSGASGNGTAAQTATALLVFLSLCHLCNDLAQSLLPAIYPLLKTNFALSFEQIGMITLTYQVTASLLQPLIGSYTDRRPLPYSLPFGMCFTVCGLLMISRAPAYPILLLGASLLGIGSSIFHPEASRVARLASGGRFGFAQSLFQVGGNAGSALGPLLAAFAIMRGGQKSIAWFVVIAPVALAMLVYTGRWYKSHLRERARAPKPRATHATHLSKFQVRLALGVLLVLLFSKYIYLASLTSYYTFFLISKFHVSVRDSQLYLFAFLGAVALGTMVGGPIGDRFGRKYVIWGSILGCFPFTIALPYANLFWTGVLTVIIGLILASAFSAIVVYGQELMPGNVGMVAGLFFGFVFGVGGIGAAVMGQVADHAGIAFVYKLCSFLPLMGLLTIFLPDLEEPASAKLDTATARP
jgi:MFS transporter, FSR family, fosmidomycin resistance protein